MRLLSNYYNKNYFNTFQLSVPVAVNITYTQVPTVAPPTDGRVVYMIPLYANALLISINSDNKISVQNVLCR